jgi:hypothetical protein
MLITISVIQSFRRNSALFCVTYFVAEYFKDFWCQISKNGENNNAETHWSYVIDSRRKLQNNAFLFTSS